ncbi:unnamed protein product [Urochloa humidicola]
MASAMPLALLLLCLLVTHTHGSRRTLFRSADDDAGASPPSNAACPSIASGYSNGNKFPLVHNLSPCSPLGGSYVRKRGKAALADTTRIASFPESFN